MSAVITGKQFTDFGDCFAFIILVVLPVLWLTLVQAGWLQHLFAGLWELDREALHYVD